MPHDPSGFVVLHAPPVGQPVVFVGYVGCYAASPETVILHFSHELSGLFSARKLCQTHSLLSVDQVFDRPMHQLHHLYELWV